MLVISGDSNLGVLPSFLERVPGRGPFIQVLYSLLLV